LPKTFEEMALRVYCKDQKKELLAKKSFEKWCKSYDGDEPKVIFPMYSPNVLKKSSSVSSNIVFSHISSLRKNITVNINNEANIANSKHQQVQQKEEKKESLFGMVMQPKSPT
jgi:hypothetical protein